MGKEAREKNLKFLEREASKPSYKGFARVSYEQAIKELAIALGQEAQILESSLREKGAGSGLFLIRLVCEGVPLGEAREMIRNGEVPELFKWQKKHAENWRDIRG